jgi:O-methyltransferase domain/Dimerisation domain
MVAWQSPFWPLVGLLRRASRKDWRLEIKALLRTSRLSTGKDTREDKNGLSPTLLFKMATGFWISQAFYVAAKLGIADLLKDGPLSSMELAAATHSDSASLYRLMRALASIGIFTQRDGDHFALSDVGQSLRTDVHGSLRHTVITLGEIHYQACGNLLYSVQTGFPGFDRTFGTTLFDYLQRNADAAAEFHSGMANVSSMLAYAVLMVYDFEGISSIVDVGGGQGALLEKILQFHPKITGTVFDTSSTIDAAEQQLHNNGRAKRCSYLAGDFFISLPKGADAYLLCGVIHDWDDNRAVTILENCRDAMSMNSRLLIIDMVVPKDSSRCFSKFLDLNMLVMTGGKERTKVELAELMGAAGLRINQIIPTPAPQSIIEVFPSRENK